MASAAIKEERISKVLLHLQQASSTLQLARPNSRANAKDKDGQTPQGMLQALWRAIDVNEFGNVLLL